MKTKESALESLNRAVGSMSLGNFPIIYEGFLNKGIPEVDIKPRENIFTYNAWRALGRQVKKGEKGVKIVTYIPKENGDGVFPKTTTVFHISQTEEVENEK